MTHLVIKTLLIFLVLRPLEFAVLAAAALLFAGWHATIVGWHLFAVREYDDYTVSWLSHAAMGGMYLGLVPVFFATYRHLSAPYERFVAVLLLSTVVVWYATRRKQTLIETVG